MADDLVSHVTERLVIRADLEPATLPDITDAEYEAVVSAVMETLYLDRWRIVQTCGYIPDAGNGWSIEREWTPHGSGSPAETGEDDT